MSGFLGNGPGGVGRFSRFHFVASAGQTVFGGPDKNGLTLRYTPGQVETIIDGVWVTPDDVTATDGSTITIASGVPAGTPVYFFAPTNFGIADSISFLVEQALTSEQQALARANIGIQTAPKNYIVNGGMQVSQENGAVAGTANGYYPVDQFRTVISGTSGVVSSAQVAKVTPGGSPNRIRATVTTADAAVAASDLVGFITKIEGSRVADLLMGSVSAKTVTLAFGVNMPAGTYGVTFQNDTATRNYTTTYTISAEQAGTDVIVPITLDLDKTGTWIKDATGAGLTIVWGLMIGSNFAKAAGAWGTDASGIYGPTGQSNFMATLGNVFELFDVGLYEGDTAPAFQLPDFATELVLCQRYWEKSYSYGTAVGSTSVVPGAEAMLHYSTGSISTGKNVVFGVRKRVAPTALVYSLNTGASGQMFDAQTSADKAATVDGLSDRGMRNFCVVASANLALYWHWTASARM